MDRVKINGVNVSMKNGLEVIAHCRRATLSMADGKMVTTLLQLGGAYCTMCTKNQAQCHRREVIEEGFVIDRSVESLNDLALSLTDEDTGEVVRKRGDYEVRQGVMDKPISKSDITKNVIVHENINALCKRLEV